MSQPGDDEVTRRAERTLARGTGLAFLSRGAAFLGPLTLLVFAQLYGAASLGIFVLLSAYAQGANKLVLLAAPKALQRYVPAHPDAATEIVRGTLALAMGLACGLAVAVSLAAPGLAGALELGGLPQGEWVQLIRLTAWILPARVLVRVPLHAVRARQAFGSDLVVRTAVEPLLLLLCGVAFHAAGFGLRGLFLGALLAQLLTAVPAVALLLRHYEPARLRRPRPGVLAPLRGERTRFALQMTAFDLVSFLQLRVDLFILGAMLSGAEGAALVAAYEVARRLASALTGIRKSVEYVVAPVSAELGAARQQAGLQHSYTSTLRWTSTLAIPLAALLIALRGELLRLFGPEFALAAPALVLLVLGRLVDVRSGPATMLVAMLGRPWLPLANVLASTAVAALVVVLAVPLLGLSGAALGVAVGLLLMRVVATFQVRTQLGLHARDRRALRPVAFQLAAAAVLFAGVELLPVEGWSRLALVLPWSAALLYGTLRFGLDPGDRELVERSLARRRGGSGPTPALPTR